MSEGAVDGSCPRAKGAGSDVLVRLRKILVYIERMTSLSSVTMLTTHAEEASVQTLQIMTLSMCGHSV